MRITPIRAFTDNYIWVIKDEDSNQFDCVDPGDAAPVIHYAQDNHLQLRNILLTHHHHDHIGGVADLITTFQAATVYGPGDPRIPFVDIIAKEHDLISLGSNQFRVLSNPGHTSTHISYYEPTKEWLFCGDTLFSAGCGRVFDGTIEQLHQSLWLFKSLPPTTEVYCAHEYTAQNLRFAHEVEPQNPDITALLNKLNAQPQACSLPSTIARELLINPFLRTEYANVVAYALQQGAQFADSLEVFSTLRQAKNSFK